MTLGLRLRLAALAAAAVVVAGLLWMALSQPTYESHATVVLTPAVEDPELATELLNSVLVTGTVGTYEHYLASSDRVEEALPDDVEISVRAIPDTRVISLRTTGPRDEVERALRAVLALRPAADAELGGLWRLDAIQTAQAPARAGLSALAMLVAILAAALLAALVVLVALRRLARRRPASGPRAVPAPEPEREASVHALP